jgi:hypothetical protein
MLEHKIGFFVAVRQVFFAAQQKAEVINDSGKEPPKED